MLYHDSLYYPVKYQWSNLQRDTLFNAHRVITNRSLNNAKRNLLETEHIDDIYTAVGLSWLESINMDDHKNYVKDKK